VTRDEFHRKAVRRESAGTVSFDVRPFGSRQDDAVTVFLGEQEFRRSIGSLDTSRSVVLVVDGDFLESSQIRGFIQHLKPSLPVSIQRN
jgi:hypothetical protein